MNDENKSNPLETQLTEMNNDPDYQYWTSTYNDLNETITMPSWSKKKFLKKIHFVIYDAARVGCLKKLPSFKVKKKTASTCFVAIFLIKMGSKPSCPLSEGEYGKVETALAKWGWDWRGMTSGGDNKIVKLTRKWMIRSLFDANRKRRVFPHQNLSVRPTENGKKIVWRNSGRLEKKTDFLGKKFVLFFLFSWFKNVQKTSERGVYIILYCIETWRGARQEGYYRGLEIMPTSLRF